MQQDAVESVVVFDKDVGRAEELGRRLRFLNFNPIIAAEEDPVPENSIAAVLGNPEAAACRRQLRRLTRERPELPLLVLGEGSTRGDAELAGNARPVWHLEKPVRRAELLRLLERARRYGGRERRRQPLVGNSRPLRAVRRLIEQVADFDTTVLVTGESGTGKELVARRIHELSARAGHPFVPVNCGAIPADLLESELFGHEKGAFSGAVAARTGRFELAEGGTLFLDEIGDMSLPMQVKLLRVLEERRFERVGSNESRKCDVRIIAATHRDLPALVRHGDFREDLYYRLNVFPIELPPLCKRQSDLPGLLDELLVRHQEDGAARLRITPEALAALAAYPWPGNVRELSNLVERLAILKPGGEIGFDDLPPKYRSGASVLTGAASAPAGQPEGDLRSYLQDVERDLIGQALAQAGGVVAHAARLLKLRRTTLVEKITRYGLA